MFTSKHLTKCIFFSMALALCAIFFACGDSSSGSDDIEKVSVVDSISELPDCDKDYEGEQVFVVAESAMRICAGGKWYALKDSSDSSDPKKDQKDTVAKDSVSKDSVSKDSTKSDSTDVDKPDVPKDTVELDSEKIATSLDSLVGYSQKGPFTTGSDVYLYELESGRTLKQTNGNFTSNIVNDKGRYHFAARDLVSQYAMVVVDGNYRNEVTGKVSDNKIRLKAITDLSKRTSANVNLLSHLEYDRVYYLVTKEKMKVYAAKRQAQQEILTQFYIDSKNFKESEDLDVFGKTDADGALLAVSILLQGNRTEAELTALLTMISTDLADSGRWKNDSIKADIADWIFEKDSLDLLKQFRANVKGWGLSDTVPNYEKYVRNYWYYNYGLKECSTKGKVVKNSNKKSSRKDHYFICKNDRWQVAEDIEQDIYQWANGNDGETKAGSVNKNNIYVFDKDHWRPANNEESVLGGCIESKAGNVGVAHDEYYICRDREWVVATDIEKDTYNWEAGTDGQTKPGDVNNNLTYVYDSDHWRPANDAIEAELGGCVTTGMVKHTATGQYYTCENRSWRTATNLEMDTDGWAAGTDGDTRPGSVNSNLTYVYDSDHWREANAQEAEFGGCIQSRNGEVKKATSGQYYTCDNRTWRTATNIEMDTDGWSTNYTDGKAKYGKVNTSYVYVLENGAWRRGNDMDMLMYNAGGTGCISEGARSIRYTDKYYYICTKQSSGDIPHIWVRTEELYSDTAGYQSQCKTGGTYADGRFLTGYVSGKKYVCDSDHFRTLKNNESKWQKGCVSYISGNDVILNGQLSYYTCNLSKGWVFNISKNSGTITDTRETLLNGTSTITYGTITIGNQVWMSEDMKFDMGSIFYVDGAYVSITTNYDCCDPWNSHTRIYASNVLDTLCPTGWHIPSYAEWQQLIDYVEGFPNLLKSCSYQTWSNETNAYGFSAYGNAIYFEDKIHTCPGSECTSTLEDSDRKASFWLNDKQNVIQYSESLHNYTTKRLYDTRLAAVRCVKN